jgi:hypothetical protein
VVRLGQHPLWGVDPPGSGRASGSACALGRERLSVQGPARAVLPLQ